MIKNLFKMCRARWYGYDLRMLFVVFAIAILIGSCSVPRKPYETRPVSLPSESFPPKPAVVPPPEQPAAAALYQQAEKSLLLGEYQKAEMTLERALRIDPRNARYWYAMAEIKYQQEDYKRVIQFCQKSKSLNERDAHLRRLTDELLAKANSKNR